MATYPNVNAAQVRNNTQALLHILKAADGGGKVINFELTNPKITFGKDGSITNLESEVVRATDWNFKSNIGDAQ